MGLALGVTVTLKGLALESSQTVPPGRPLVSEGRLSELTAADSGKSLISS